jgi:flavin-dependent dehydrogenase
MKYFLKSEVEMSKNETVETDVLIIGAGPSGLATAIALANSLKARKLSNWRVMVLEKGKSVGAHILSGAVIKPAIFRTCSKSTSGVVTVSRLKKSGQRDPRGILAGNLRIS